MHANKSEPLIIGTDPETGQELTLWDKKGGRVIGAGQGMAALWDELTERVAARPDAVLLQASPDGQARRTLQYVWDTIVARSRSRRRTRMHQPTRGQPLIVLAIGEAEAVAALDDNLGALLNGIASKCRSEGVSLVLGRGEAQVTSWEQVPR